MYLLLTSILISSIAWIYLKRQRKNPERILGIYSQEGNWYHLKYIAMLLIFKLRKFSSRKKNSGMGYNVSNIENLEQLQPLSSEKKAFDAVFYHGVSRNGYYFVGGIERRQNQKVNGLVYLVVPKLGLLHSEHMPKTELNADLNLKNSFAGGGMSFVPMSPMKQWNIRYEGKMWEGDEKNKRWYKVKFEAEFTSDLPHFTVDTDSDRKALARALAKETWTKEFFEILESSHQTHYEQMGIIKGRLTIDDKVEEIDMMGFRDHSFGNKRDWTLMHRYIFHMFYMDDDTRISCGVISQPCSISHFEIGYVIGGDKKIYPIQECDLMLYQHGEDGHLPKQLAFSFVSNNKNYDCKIKYVYDSVHYKGSDIEARLYERFFTCEVNGCKGKGVSEWHYNNVGTYTSNNNNN